VLRHRTLAVIVFVAAVVLVVWRGTPAWATALAAMVAYLIIALGLGVLGMLASPVPEPPPPGELRKVRLTFQCGVCGTEVRMTAAAEDDPEPPRHCLDEMRLVSNPYDE
jgi:peptidoglycan/LPS O-acetylase OafA/YrhL